MYDYYENYYEIPEEDLKTDFHIALDKIIDIEVEKRLEERIRDIDRLRETQKQYDEKIAEANNKVKEADTKRLEAERERDNTIKQCEQSISEVAQQKLDNIFGDWLDESYVYYLVRDRNWLYCPYCKSGQVEITLSNGDKATTKCKVCNGDTRQDYDYYEVKSITTEYPCLVADKSKRGRSPYFVSLGWNGGKKVALRDVMTQEKAEKKAQKLNEENKQKVLKRLEERKKKLDEENKQ